MNLTTSIRQRLGSHTAVIAAGIVGFAVGAGGFAAAQVGPSDASTRPRMSTVVSMSANPSFSSAATTPDDAPNSTAAAVSVPVTSDDTTDTTDVPASSTTVDTTDDATPSTTHDTTSSTTADTTDDATSSTTVDTTSSTTVDTTDDATPSTTDDTTSSTTATSGPSTSVVDTTSSTTPDTTVADALPGPFTETYSSAGGSITVSWSGTAFSLQAVSPSDGFHAEIEDDDWDRIRVDFDGHGGDSRVEVRVHDGRIRVRID